MSTTLRFCCARYADRPVHCRDYPWEDAQILFRDCQFFDGKGLIPLAALVKNKGEGAVESYCLACGKCCFAWTRKNGKLNPVARCSSLVVDGEAQAASQSQCELLRVRGTVDF